MAARRANQVLATVGLFAALGAARIAVDLFPASRAVDAIAHLVQIPADAPDASPDSSSGQPAEELAAATVANPEPAGAEAPPRRTTSHPTHGSTRPSVRLIRAPTIPS